MTHTLLRSHTIEQLTGAINEQTIDLSYEEQSMVLSRVIGTQLALITELRADPAAAHTEQQFLERLSDIIITTQLAEVNSNGH